RVRAPRPRRGLCLARPGTRPDHRAPGARLLPRWRTLRAFSGLPPDVLAEPPAGGGSGPAVWLRRAGRAPQAAPGPPVDRAADHERRVGAGVPGLSAGVAGGRTAARRVAARGCRP